jgi:tripartite motif-containing protein 71
MNVARRVIVSAVVATLVSAVGGTSQQGLHASSALAAVASAERSADSVFHFVRPAAVATGPGGRIYVADWDTARIYAVDSAGRVVAHWGGPGTAPGRFEHPDGLTVDRQGNVYVSNDTGTSPYDSGFQIEEFSPEGAFLRGWGGIDLVQFRGPHGVAVDSGGNLYAADWGHSRIVIFPHDGGRPRQWAMAGTEPGQFDHPLAISIDAHDLVYVVDCQGTRLQRLTTMGEPVAQIKTGLASLWFGPSRVTGQANTGLEQLPYLQGLTVDHAGNLYLTDWMRSRVLQLSPSGRVEARLTLPKLSGNQTVGMDGVAIDDAGNVYVAEFWLGHIERLAVGTRHFQRWM